MKILLIVVLVLLVLTGAWWLLFPPLAGAGTVLPAFSLKTMHGLPVTDRDLAGARTCLVFVSIDDGRLAEVFPFLRTVEKDGEDIAALRFVLVFVDGRPDRARMVMSRYPFSGTVLLDENARLAQALHVRSTPTVFVFNTQREVVYSTASWSSEGLAPVVSALRGSP